MSGASFHRAYLWNRWERKRRFQFPSLLWCNLYWNCKATDKNHCNLERGEGKIGHLSQEEEVENFYWSDLPPFHTGAYTKQVSCSFKKNSSFFPTRMQCNPRITSYLSYERWFALILAKDVHCSLLAMWKLWADYICQEKGIYLVGQYFILAILIFQSLFITFE